MVVEFRPASRESWLVVRSGVRDATPDHTQLDHHRVLDRWVPGCGFAHPTLGVSNTFGQACSAVASGSRQQPNWLIVAALAAGHAQSCPGSVNFEPIWLCRSSAQASSVIFWPMWLSTSGAARPGLVDQGHGMATGCGLGQEIRRVTVEVSAHGRQAGGRVQQGPV